MRFTIDGQTFGVAIASRPLIKNGQPCKARIDYVARRIWLSDQLPRHERRRELFHELRHAWVDTRGQVQGNEAEAIDVAEMMDLLLEQFLAEGGNDTLEALNPEVQPSTARKFNSSPMMQVSSSCGCCGASVMVGSINSTPPEWSAEIGSHYVDRGMFCEACGSVTVWRELASAEGMPTGAIVAYPKPQVLAGAAAGRWIAEHAEDCRVLV